MVYIEYPMGCHLRRVRNRRSETFDAWLKKLPDSKARARIAARIDRFGLRNRGDVKPVGGGVSEMRID